MVLISQILKLRISNLYIIPLKKMKKKIRKSSFQVSKTNLLNQCKETWFEWPNQAFINSISVQYSKRGKFRYSSKEENVLKKHCLTQTQLNLLGLTDDSCNRKRAYETSIQAKGVQKRFQWLPISFLTKVFLLERREVAQQLKLPRVVWKVVYCSRHDDDDGLEVAARSGRQQLSSAQLWAVLSTALLAANRAE